LPSAQLCFQNYGYIFQDLIRCPLSPCTLSTTSLSKSFEWQHARYMSCVISPSLGYVSLFLVSSLCLSALVARPPYLASGKWQAKQYKTRQSTRPDPKSVVQPSGLEWRSDLLGLFLSWFCFGVGSPWTFHDRVFPIIISIQLIAVRRYFKFKFIIARETPNSSRGVVARMQ
jgi:hypothetical protein